MQHKIVIVIMQPRKLQANLSNKVNLSLLISSHSWDLGLTGGDPGLFPHESTHVHNKHGYPR